MILNGLKAGKADWSKQKTRKKQTENEKKANRKREKSKQKTRKKQQRAAKSELGMGPHDFTTTQYYIYNGGRGYCRIFSTPKAVFRF